VNFILRLSTRLLGVQRKVSKIVKNHQARKEKNTFVLSFLG